MAPSRRSRWTRSLNGLLGVGIVLAAFVLAAVLNWVDPGDIPVIGTWVDANVMGIAIGSGMAVLIVWLLREALRSSGLDGALEAPLEPVTARIRTDLLDDLSGRYGRVRRDALQYKVGERLATLAADGVVEVHVPLDMRTRPDQVVRPPLCLYTGVEPAALPPALSITDIYDEEHGRLLVLGLPGAGKSTHLLGLALDLIGRARIDERHPVPIIANLAAWAEDRLPLNEWLERRLPAVLGVSSALSRSLVRGHHLLLLLDGLDEVEEAHRGPCIKAINAYLGERKEKAVVCCRSEEYEAVRKTLNLTAAIEILPLDADMVVERLSHFPVAYEIREALRADASLRGMVTTPLLLSVVLLTYLGTAVPDFSGLPVRTRLRALWDDYIVAMLRRRYRSTENQPPPYTPHEVLTWLVWLSRRMKAEDMTDFLLDRMQPEWLARPRRFRMASGIIFGVAMGPALGLGFWLVIDVKYYAILLISILITIGISLLFLLNKDVSSITPFEAIRWSWGDVIDGFKREWVVRLIAGTVFGAVVGLTHGLVVAIGGGLLAGPGSGALSDGFSFAPLTIAERPGTRVRRSVVNGLAFGLTSGLVGGTLIGLIRGIPGGVAIGLASGLFGWLLGSRHFFLRALLVHEGSLPWRTERFLLFASDVLLLQRENDLIRFRHLLLRDHLADETDMTPAHTEMLSARVGH